VTAPALGTGLAASTVSLLLGRCDGCGDRDATETYVFGDGATLAVCPECRPQIITTSGEVDRTHVGRRDLDGSVVVAYRDAGGGWQPLLPDTPARFDWGSDGAGTTTLALRLAVHVLAADAADPGVIRRPGRSGRCFGGLPAPARLAAHRTPDPHSGRS
jgi:ribosomal protein S27E